MKKKSLDCGIPFVDTDHVYNGVTGQREGIQQKCERFRK